MGPFLYLAASPRNQSGFPTDSAVVFIANRFRSGRNRAEVHGTHVSTRVPRQLALAAPVVIAGLLGSILSLAAFTFVWRLEEAVSEKDLASVTASYVLSLQNGLNDYLSKLVALRAFVEASPQVTRLSFEAFAGKLLENEGAIKNFSWVARVSRSERAHVEAEAQREGIPDFRIKAVAASGAIIPSPEQDEYLPILYSTVEGKTSPIYGIDLRTEPVIQQRLDRARDLNALSAVPNFILHSVAGNVHGFLFSLPVYQRGLYHETLQDRRRNLIGFVHGAFLTGRAIEHILQTTTAVRGLDLSLFAADAGPNDPPIYVHSSRLRSVTIAPRTQAELATDRHSIATLSAGEAAWRVVAVPVPGGPLATAHDRAWLVLAAGLSISAIVVLYVSASIRHARRLLHANGQISKLAQKDPLTGLFNRRAFNEHLAAAFAASRRGCLTFSVLYFDLDHFKDINDTLGHPAGDRLLQNVAERVRAVVRRTDVVARFGGDEFAVLQTGVSDFGTATPLAVKLNKMLAAPFTLNGHDVRITASIGIAHYSGELAEPDAIMVRADLALYRAKEDGRNCFRFHSQELDRDLHERVAISEQLRRALDRQELELYYQPQVDVVSGRIIGAEALLRWNHSTRGLLRPGTFMSIAERTGSIVTIGEWIVEQACRQIKAWEALGIAPVVLAVNFSAVQFKASADLDAQIAATLRKWDVTPGQLEVELTESMLFEVTQQHREIFDRLRKLGVRIAIDDFGTGYSSLNYLTSYPVNRLKIAQELVRGVISDPRYATVVRAAVHLANELGIGCIAEGVETEGQVKFLISAGCKFAQGHYFGKPVPAVRMTELFHNGEIRSKRSRCEDDVRGRAGRSGVAAA
jgi:diguanylate cyclase